MFPGLSLSPVVDRYVLSSLCQSVPRAVDVGWYMFGPRSRGVVERYPGPSPISGE